MFVMNSHTIKGEATIRKEDGTKYKKDVDNIHIYVSWITDGDKTQELGKFRISCKQLQQQVILHVSMINLLKSI